MSVQAITLALTVQGITPSEKLLLIVLANYADEHLKCWPSYARLAKDTCMSRRNLIRVSDKLTEHGLIKRTPRAVKGGRTSDMIYLLLGGDNLSLWVVTGCHRGSDTVSPKPKENHHLKRSAREAEPDDRLPRALMAQQMRELGVSLRNKRSNLFPTPLRPPRSNQKS